MMLCPTITKAEKLWAIKSKKINNLSRKQIRSGKQGDNVIPLKIQAGKSVKIAIVEGLKGRGVERVLREGFRQIRLIRRTSKNGYSKSSGNLRTRRWL